MDRESSDHEGGAGAPPPISSGTPEQVDTLPDGRPVHLLVLGAAPGLEVHLLDLGATVHRILVTGGDGVRRDVTLGHPTVADRLAGTDYLGGTVGRYANRIARGRFHLDGREVQVEVNDRGNCLHGGPDGFDRRLWDVVDSGPTHAVLALHSPDGDQGFPGAVDVRARFEVDGDRLSLELAATTDAPTPVNVTSHLYLNLEGGVRTTDDHLLQVLADAWTPVDATGIPVGDAEPVDGTPFDLREPRRVGDVVRRRHPQLEDARGVDHNLVLRGEGMRPVARLAAPATGTAVELACDQPGLQVYTGNFLDGTSLATDGGLLRQGDGIALEPQLPPDSPNRPGPGGATGVLRPGETYRSAMSWTFSRTPVGPG